MPNTPATTLPLAGETVLLTGAGGFLGRHLLAALGAAGAGVITLGRGAAPPGPALGHIACDLAVAGPEAGLAGFPPVTVILHAAGLTGASRDAAGRTALMAANLTATLRVLDLAAGLPGRPRLLLVGSAAVYAPAAGAVDEDHPWRPVSAYGASKAAAALAGLALGAEDGLSVSLGIPFNIIGPGQPAGQVPQAFLAQMAGERCIRTGDLSSLRDWIDVRDVAAALVALLSPGTPPGVFNIATGQGLSTGALLDRLLALSGPGWRVETDAARLRPALVPSMIGNPGRLRAATGWRPRFGLDQSLSDMVRTMRANG